MLVITWASITKDNTITTLTSVTYVNDDRISCSRGDEAESDGRPGYVLALRIDVTYWRYVLALRIGATAPTCGRSLR